MLRRLRERRPRPSSTSLMPLLIAAAATSDGVGAEWATRRRAGPRGRAAGLRGRRRAACDAAGRGAKKTQAFGRA